MNRPEPTDATPAPSPIERIATAVESLYRVDRDRRHDEVLDDFRAMRAERARTVPLFAVLVLVAVCLAAGYLIARTDEGETDGRVSKLRP